MATLNVGTWLAQAIAKLAATSEQPALEAQVLLAHVLQKNRTWVLAHPEYILSPLQLDTLEQIIDRLKRGEPLPYLLGHWEFFGWDFMVSPAVLIPRPETELLVEHAVQWLRQNPCRRLAADVGTGSGCIAISIANQIPDLTVLASDYSGAALRIARANISHYRLNHRIYLVQADLMTAAAGSFDLVCANLPYIPTSTLDHLQVSRYEPRLALDGGIEGLDYIQKLLFDTVAKLAPGALFLLEIETRQSDSALRLAQLSYPSAEAQVIPDLVGNPRLLKIKL